MIKLKSFLIIAFIWIAYIFVTSAFYQENNNSNSIQSDVRPLWMVFSFVPILIYITSFSLVKDGLNNHKNSLNNTYHYLSSYFFSYTLFLFLGGSFLLMPFSFGNLLLGSYQNDYSNSIDFPSILFSLQFPFLILILITTFLIDSFNFKGFIISNVIIVVFILPFYLPIFMPIPGAGGYLFDHLTLISNAVSAYDIKGAIYVHFFSAMFILSVALLMKKNKFNLIKIKEYRVRAGFIVIGLIGIIIMILTKFGINKPSILYTPFYFYIYLLIIGGLSAIICHKLLFKHFKLSALLDGVLTSLTAVLIDTKIHSEEYSIAIAVSAGFSVILINGILNKLKIYNPGSIISIHGIGGLCGAFAICFFTDQTIENQMKGIILTISIASFSGLVLFYILKYFKGFSNTKESNIQDSYPIQWVQTIEMRIASILAITLLL